MRHYAFYARPPRRQLTVTGIFFDLQTCHPLSHDLVQRLQAARRDLRLPAELAKLDCYDLLILDYVS